MSSFIFGAVQTNMYIINIRYDTFKTKYTRAVDQSWLPFSIDGAVCGVREDTETEPVARHTRVVDGVSIRRIHGDFTTGVVDDRLRPTLHHCKPTSLSRTGKHSFFFFLL